MYEQNLVKDKGIHGSCFVMKGRRSRTEEEGWREDRVLR